MRSRLSRLVALYESERYRRTYGRKADHSRAYTAAVAQDRGGPSWTVVALDLFAADVRLFEASVRLGVDPCMPPVGTVPLGCAHLGQSHLTEPDVGAGGTRADQDGPP